MMTDQPIRAGRFEVVAPGFFFMPLREIEIETDAVINRTLFVWKGKVVAVARRKPSIGASR